MCSCEDKCIPNSKEFCLTHESSEELHARLDKYGSVVNVPLRDVASVENIHPYFQHLVHSDRKHLVKILRGICFDFNYNAKFPTINVCCVAPNILVMPRHSIYGNRMFLINGECAWLEVFAELAEDVDFYNINSLPHNILVELDLVPRAQVFDANFNVDTEKFAHEMISVLSGMFAHSLVGEIIDTAKMMGLVLQFVSIIKNPNVWAVSSFLYQVLLNCRVASGLIVKTLRYLDEYIERCLSWFRPTAQSGTFDGFSDLGAVILTLMSVAGLSALPSKSMVLETVKIAGLLGRGVSGLNMTIDVLSKNMISIMDWCYFQLFGVPRSSEMYGIIEADVLNFIRNVNEISRMDTSVDMRDNNELRDRIREVRQEGHDLQAKLTKLKIDVRGLGYFVQFVNRIDKIAEKADIHCISGDGPRPEPVVIQFFGQSGCGKSHIPYFIACDLVEDMGYKDDPISYMYYRSVEQEFFDGYSQKKKIVVYDDFGQKKDSANVPNPEFMELIRSGNIAAWPLHMANLSEKANTYFRSKAIILTSNKVNYNIESLTHDDAFVRRIDLRFEVKVDPKFTDQFGVIDEDKVEQHLNVKCSEQIFSFVPYIRVKKGIYNDFVPEPTMVNNVATSTVLTYEQMVERVLTAFHKRQAHGSARLEAIERHRNNLRARAQVLLSSAEEFLASFWRHGGSVDRYYSIDESLRARLLELADKTDNIFEFIATVLNERVQLQFDVIQRDSEAEQVFVVFPDSKFVKDNSTFQAQSVLSSLKESMLKIANNSWFKGIVLAFGVVAAVSSAYKLYDWFRPVNLFGISNTQSEVQSESPKNETKAAQHVRVETKQEAESPPNITPAQPHIRVENCCEAESPKIITPAAPHIRVEHDDSLIVSPTKLIGPVSQAYVDSNANEIIQNVLACNIYRVGGLNQNYAANIIFIAGRMALCNWHVYDFLSQYEEISIKNPYIQRGYTLKYASLKCYRITSADDEFKDAVILEFPPFVVTHKNMLKQFVESKDISSFKSSRGILVGVCSAARDKLLARVQPLEKISAIDSLKYYYMDKNKVDQGLLLRKGYKYQSQTAAGDCGSLLLVNDSAIPRKICGIHVAGSIGGGFAISITKDDLIRTLQTVPFSSRIGFSLPETVNCEVRSECLPVGEFIPYGVNSVVGSCPVKTDIFPSKLHGKVSEPKCLPSVLRPGMLDGQLVDPLILGIEKCGQPHILLDEFEVQCAVDDLTPVILKGADPSHQRVLSYEEAIMGTNDIFMCPVNRRSSAGYGWSDKTGGKVGKTKWLGEDEYILDDVDLKSAVMERERLALEGERMAHLWVDTLKVERRPIEKIKEFKTRVFSVGQMDFVILCRKYFLGFCAHIMHNRIDNEIAVGINPYSYEWTYVAERQQSVGGKCISADFKNYDGCLMNQLLLEVYNLYVAFMELNKDNIGMPWEDFLKISRVLFDEMICSIHLCRDSVYGWTHSNPSGNPLTTIKNCIYALLLVRMCYIRATGSIKDFQKNVKVLQFGDDEHIGISDAVIEVFNQHSMTEIMKTFGMTYTDEHKSDNPPPWRPIAETTFLKRGFQCRNGRYDAPLCLDTCLEMLNWVKGTKDTDDLLISNIETSCMELSLHDKDTFTYWSKRIKQKSYEVGLFPVIYSYENYRHMLFLGQVEGSRAIMNNHDGYNQECSE